jgi:gas vesicle structural protein
MHDEGASRESGIPPLALNDAARVSLCELLDRVLNKGIVVVGEATISVADIDLVYLGLQVVLTSIETCRQGFRNPLVELGAGTGLRNGKSYGST